MDRERQAACTAADVMVGRSEDLRRIYNALVAAFQMLVASDALGASANGTSPRIPLATLDCRINMLIQNVLPLENEGWLSEESYDDLKRLRHRRVWVVDPVDGTRELRKGIPEWCVSIGLVEKNEPVAGGVLNPSTGELFLGSVETGVQVLYLNGGRSDDEPTARFSVLVSRREYDEGKWVPSKGGSLPFTITPMGSIAYRLAHVAAGYAAATCTFGPRSEWDVAGGVALVRASGGRVETMSGDPVRCNREVPRFDSFFASANYCSSSLRNILALCRFV
jgi:myo-inositol-1(or 4)-monophosphatase